MMISTPQENRNIVKLAGGRVTILKAEERIRKYCELEIYEGFDDCTTADNMITVTDIETSKRIFSMVDQYGHGESARILSSESIRSKLGVIPNRELSDMSDDEWVSIKKDLRGLLASFLSIDYVGLAKAGKIIHIKRPKLVPILDSYVLNLLTGVNPGDVYSKNTLLGLGMHALEVARNDIRSNMDFFRTNKSLEALPIPLSSARLYDILCWTYWKWEVKKIRSTTRWKKQVRGYVQVRGYLDGSICLCRG